MDTETVLSTLRDFIRSEFKIPETDSEFCDDVHLFDYGYIDSFGAIRLIAYIEKAYNIKISESDLAIHPLNTIQEISGFVIRRKKGEI